GGEQTRAKPTPPAAIARRIRPKRLQSVCTNRDRPPSMTRVTRIERTTPRVTFSPSRAHLLTSPRVRRAKAFSSPSRASEPATRRTVTNISVTVAATEIAKASRLGGDPETPALSTWIACAIDERSGVARLRFWRARRAKLITRARSAADGLFFGSP